MYDDTVDVTPEGVSEGAALSGMFGESAPVETERGIETITEEIIFYKNVGGQAVIEIGRRLTEAKAQLKHGEWLPWLREKVEFSETSAQNFMRIAREYGNTHLVGDLGASKALVLLALPASERENFASEKHLVNGEEKSVSEMSKRELEEAIRQRKLAELERDKMQRELDEQRKAGELPAEVARVYDDLKKLGYAPDAANTNIGSAIFANKPGDGSAREQAASCQRVLGAGANIVTEYATKRYRSNLINWGMLPLQLAGATPFGLGDYILIPNVREALKGDLKDIKAYVLGDEPKAFDLYMAPLTDDERQILADGCLINFYKH
jgi:hypothetical protein